MGSRRPVIRSRRASTRAVLALMACLGTAAGSAQLPPEPMDVERLSARPGPHWVWVNDVSFFAFPDGRAFLVDGDAGRLLGMLSTG